MQRRWDSDERGTGVADAGALVQELDRLREAMLEDGWVAEAPEDHLLPHVRRLCAHRGWELRAAAVEDSVLEVEVVMPAAGRRERLMAAYELLGSFAESASFVRQSEAGNSFELDLATGVLAGDTEFAAHGHTVRLRVSA